VTRSSERSRGSSKASCTRTPATTPTRTGATDAYHVVLFAGWADDAHTEWFALQELATGSPAMLSKHYWTELGEYRPIRKVGL
jgi:hypothetical protein